MTLKKIFKLLKSGIQSDRDIARELLNGNAELRNRFREFVYIIGDTNFSNDPKVIKITGQTIDYWWGDSNSLLEEDQDTLLKKLEEIYKREFNAE